MSERDLLMSIHKELGELSSTMKAADRKMDEMKSSLEEKISDMREKSENDDEEIISKVDSIAFRVNKLDDRVTDLERRGGIRAVSAWKWLIALVLGGVLTTLIRNIVSWGFDFAERVSMRISLML